MEAPETTEAESILIKKNLTNRALHDGIEQYRAGILLKEKRKISTKPEAAVELIRLALTSLGYAG